MTQAASSRFIDKIPGIGIARKIIRLIASSRRNFRVLVKHPFDNYYDVNTSGYIRKHDLVDDKVMADKIEPYIAVEPSVVRHALETLPEMDEYTFIDLGCGKGRAAIIASEFYFNRIIGVEISPRVARIANKNAGVIRRQYPWRTKIEIMEGNAGNLAFNDRKLVLFNFHAFGDEVMEQVVKNIENALNGKTEHLFFIYHNPRWGSMLDSSGSLMRWHADDVLCDGMEQRYGIKTENPTVIWQSLRGAYPLQHKKPDRTILMRDGRGTTLAN